jgi:ribosomal protein L5
MYTIDEVTYVTVRGPKAVEILNRVLHVKDSELRHSCFYHTGNFGFRIKEHIDLGIQDDPEIDIHCLDIYVVLERPGMRVIYRNGKWSRIGHHHVTKQEAKDWFLKTFPLAELIP